MIDVRRTLEECPLHDRRLMEMHYLEGYTSKELGKKTGCTAVAVRVRLLRARRKLAAELRPEQEAQPENRAAESARRRHQSHESNELKIAA
jgi:DNA-directed RNA polymerase specialized sigma24 family protein